VTNPPIATQGPQPSLLSRSSQIASSPPFPIHFSPQPDYFWSASVDSSFAASRHRDFRVKKENPPKGEFRGDGLTFKGENGGRLTSQREYMEIDGSAKDKLLGEF
jgi:hypothetical protein